MINDNASSAAAQEAKNWSQDQRAKHIESSRVMIGKYELGDNSPSIEVIVKLARSFDMCVDFLLGEGLNAAYDKEMVKRLDELESLPDNENNASFITWISSSGIIKQKKPTLNDKSR